MPSFYAFGNKAPLITVNKHPEIGMCLLANLNALILDYVGRIKQPSTNLNLYITKQLPILAPEKYTIEDVQYIANHVAKLTRTSNLINKIWLTSYPSYKFQAPEERLKIRAELDAYYALLYGLTRDELRYILDPSEVMGEDYPSVTFPGLKRNEIKQYGEYLTRRLVLEAYDELQKSPRFSGDTSGE